MNASSDFLFLGLERIRTLKTELGEKLNLPQLRYADPYNAANALRRKVDFRWPMIETYNLMNGWGIENQRVNLLS